MKFNILLAWVMPLCNKHVISHVGKFKYVHLQGQCTSTGTSLGCLG